MYARAAASGFRTSRRSRPLRQLVQRAYDNPHGPERALIQSLARKIYGIQTRYQYRAVDAPLVKLIRPAGLPEAALDDVTEAARMLNARIDLGRHPIGVDDLLIECAADSAIEAQTYLYGFYNELPLLRLYQSLLKPGDKAVDVGANIGVHTIVLAHVTDDVWAYEPMQGLRHRLEHNIDLNGLAGVNVRPIGLGAERGTVRFTQASGFNQGVGRVDPTGDQEIEVTTLDDEVREAKLLKIDVEGYELEVLGGAQDLLARCHPYVIVEYNGWALDDLRALFPYPINIIRIPNAFDEHFWSVRERVPPGFANLLITEETWMPGGQSRASAISLA